MTSKQKQKKSSNITHIHTQNERNKKCMNNLMQHYIFLYQTLYVVCTFVNVIKSSLMLFYKCNRFNETK